MKHLSIVGRRIGQAYPPFMVAELSGNHLGRLENARRLVEAAAEAGADAVKLQTYTADTITLNASSSDFEIRSGTWRGRTLHDLYQEAHTPWEWHEPLFEQAAELGMVAFSSPFDSTSIDFLEGINCPAYKIASFEIVDLELIQRAASTNKPVLISTGMATSLEIADAVEAARGGGTGGIALLHAVSSYPAPAEEANLRTIPELARRFSAPVGLSDHTPGEAVAIAAIPLGACVIEKHLTFDRSAGGPDAAFSLEPSEYASLSRSCRIAWAALGDERIGPTQSERENLIFRRSLYAVRDIKAGEPLTHVNVRSIRPAYGLPPKHLHEVLGRTARTDIPRGTPLTWGVLD